VKNTPTRTPERQAWVNMLRRCGDPRSIEYPHYGARSIRVCERWRVFENFLADMGPRPAASMSLDREDNDGDYTPSNCRWATRKTQQRNTSRTVMLTLSGETKPLQQWCEERNLNRRTVQWRVRHSWSAVDALSPTGAGYQYGRP
jgi:hypothetical protein